MRSLKWIMLLTLTLSFLPRGHAINRRFLLRGMAAGAVASQVPPSAAVAGVGAVLSAPAAVEPDPSHLLAWREVQLERQLETEFKLITLVPRFDSAESQNSLPKQIAQIESEIARQNNLTLPELYPIVDLIYDPEQILKLVMTESTSEQSLPGYTDAIEKSYLAKLEQIAPELVQQIHKKRKDLEVHEREEGDEQWNRSLLRFLQVEDLASDWQDDHPERFDFYKVDFININTPEKRAPEFIKRITSLDKTIARLKTMPESQLREEAIHQIVSLSDALKLELETLPERMAAPPREYVGLWDSPDWKTNRFVKKGALKSTVEWLSYLRTTATVAGVALYLANSVEQQEDEAIARAAVAEPKALPNSCEIALDPLANPVDSKDDKPESPFVYPH